MALAARMACIISNDVSRARTTRSKPRAAIVSAPQTFITAICVDACTSVSGKWLSKSVARPKSCTMKASMPKPTSSATALIASSSSSLKRRMLRAQKIFAPRAWAYAMASRISARLRFVAFARALKRSRPTYTASAPWSMARFAVSRSPAGSRSSGLFIICSVPPPTARIFPARFPWFPRGPRSLRRARGRSRCNARLAGSARR